MKNVVHNFSLLFALLITVSTYGQNEVSSELTSLIGMPLKEAHTELLANGYEIAQSSIFNSKQMWYNESTQLCKMLVWDTSTKSNVKVVDRDPRLGKNPAPVYEVNSK